MYLNFAKLVGSLAVTTVVLGGCATAARITQPLDTPGDNKAVLADCNQVFVVEFHPNFKPGSFKATMDGADWTLLFKPAPAPGGTSTAQANAAYVGASHKLQIGSDLLPGTNGYPLDKQRSSVDFTTPHDLIRFSPGYTLTIPQGGSMTVNVCLIPPPPVALSVVLTPVGSSPVSLNGNTAGVPITLTFPVVTTLQSCVPFTVQASTVPGGFNIWAASVGCQQRAVSGSVQ